MAGTSFPPPASGGALFERISGYPLNMGSFVPSHYLTSIAGVPGTVKPKAKGKAPPGPPPRGHTTKPSPYMTPEPCKFLGCASYRGLRECVVDGAGAESMSANPSTAKA